MERNLFWADQIAKQIVSRKRFHYIDKEAPRLKEYTVKTSASLSGILHIGRLSDTIRGESVVKALKGLGVRTKFIWVAEDMDPLRKVPKGVPKAFEKYIGMPVTDIPDPYECHESYARHFVSKYFDVLDKFISEKMVKYSMRAEYKKGNFTKYIKIILDSLEIVKAIQNKYRSSPLRAGWSPWTPICNECGKIITPNVISFEGGVVKYKCEDYCFEKTKAKGCGYKGENNPLKGNGKLLWKSEWASQWRRWRVVSEGAGKEYQVPGSAWWVNAEILERVLGFPMPAPIFYEHLMIDGEKMSASKGNVIYPSDWLEVAPPELLRFFYNKKLMKTRSFSWKDLPSVYKDYDEHELVFFGESKLSNKKVVEHMKRLFEISQLKAPEKSLHIPFEFASMVSQLFPSTDKSLSVFSKTGHISKKLSKKERERIEKRLEHARTWSEKYLSKEEKITLLDKPKKEILRKLAGKEKLVLREIGNALEKKDMYEKELNDFFWEIMKREKMKPVDFFRAAYLVLFGKESGPRLAPFILILGRKKVAKMLKQV